MNELHPHLSLQTGALKSPALRQITLEVARIGGVNLGQGVCQLPVPPYVLEEAEAAMKAGWNRYTNPRGLESLRKALADKLARHNGILGLDPEREILVTCGATGAFEAVCAALLDPGDEVVVFEPFYPYHVQALGRYQAQVRFVSLRPPEHELDEEALRSAVTPRTKFLLLNTPGNPTGKVFTREEIGAVSRALDESNALLVTDETYEYMTFDGRSHVSPASLPSLRDRTVTIGSYSKTFAITGWRVGYLVAPPDLAETLAALLDAVYVCAPAPLQEAVARGIARFDDAFYADLRQKYQAKRDLFAKGLTAVGLDPLVPEGAYYLACAYDRLATGLSSAEFVAQMISRTGVGAVPSDDFVRNPTDERWVRFCVAVEDDVLRSALDRLARLAPAPAP